VRAALADSERRAQFNRRTTEPGFGLAQRFTLIGSLLRVLDNPCNDFANLVGCALVLPDESGPEWHQGVFQTFVDGDAGKGRQRPIVELHIRKGDQALVSTSVVPREHSKPAERSETVED
jgi:hypothetical protein